MTFCASPMTQLDRIEAGSFARGDESQRRQIPA